MELTQLRYFLQVYRTRNISVAAAQLNVTQQAVSKQLHNLEGELGTPLFARGARGVQATPYADLLAAKVQRFLPELDALVYEIQKRDHEITGVVCLGVQCWQMSVAHGLTYGVLKRFEQTYPKVHLIWENSTPGRCRQGLIDRELDLTVTLRPDETDGMELTPLRTSRWFMLMAKDHPLAAKPTLAMEDLAGQRLILARNERRTRAEIVKALGDREKPVFVDVEDFVFDLIGQQIEGEGALMLATETALDMFNPERFALVPIQSSLWRTQLYLMRLSDVAHTPAEQALYQFLLEHWKDELQ